MSTTKQSLVDPETLEYLVRQRIDDDKIVHAIEAEHENINFMFEHAERYSNWKTDEMFLERAHLAEAAFLEKVHGLEEQNLRLRQVEDVASQKLIEEDQRTFNFIVNEMKSLKVQSDQNKVAAEKIQRGKSIMRERRSAAHQQLARIKALQERERKALADNHARKLKKMELARNINLREVEDPEIRVILRGLDFNTKTSAEENLRTQALTQKEAKVHHARVLNQLMKNQKEIEQMREIHLLQQRYISRYIDYELEIIDENEALQSEHTAKEQEMESHHKKQADLEENIIIMKLLALQLSQNERAVNRQASIIAERQRHEARILAAREVREAKRRERAFWKQEVEHLKNELRSTGHPTDGPNYLVKRQELLNNLPKDIDKNVDEAVEELEDLENDEDFENDINSPANVDDINVEAAKAREMALFETLKKSQREAVRKLRADITRVREMRRIEQQKTLNAILDAQEADVKQLRHQQYVEMSAFEETQKSSDKADEDNATSNERLYGMLPVRNFGFITKASRMNG
ncbi:UNVERIFIED_CONTAM: hypothetical protein HDU68_010418 [Siphonaria sp. JEL0065]|nr:hypothetical protein HDU68_010418 [Siphonaria sp. JEL0065]